MLKNFVYESYTNRLNGQNINHDQRNKIRQLWTTNRTSEIIRKIDHVKTAKWQFASFLEHKDTVNTFLLSY